MTMTKKLISGGHFLLLAAALLPRPLLAITNGMQEIFTSPSVFQASVTLSAPAGVGDSLMSLSTGGVQVISLKGTGEIQASKYYGDGTGLTGISTHTFKIGDSYGGGKVFWVDPTGTQVLIISAVDNNGGNSTTWGPYMVTGAQRDGLYAGKTNTFIISTTQPMGSYAAQVCKNYSVTTANNEYYDDWYLPSLAELQRITALRNELGLSGVNYWSSTEYSSNLAYSIHYPNSGYSDDKSAANTYVRCVRSGTAGSALPSMDPAPSIGDSYGGGKVFWVDAAHNRMLITATSDLGNYSWSNTDVFTGASKEGIYAGLANTVTISTMQGPGSYAARLCEDYSVTANGEYYDDWYLPSKEELTQMQLRKSEIGESSNVNVYWSSNEYVPNQFQAWIVYLSNGNNSYVNKLNPYYVRCVRGAPVSAVYSRNAESVTGGAYISSTQTFTGANTFKDIYASSISVGVSTFTVSLGRVGIGTAAPQALLDISPLGDQPAPLLQISTGGPAMLVVSSFGAVGIGLAYPSTTTVLNVYKAVTGNAVAVQDFAKAVNGDLYVPIDMDNNDVNIGGQFSARADSDRNVGYIIALNAEAERNQFGGGGWGTVQAAIGLRVGNFRNYNSGGSGKVVATYGILIDSQTMGLQDTVYTLYSADRYAPAYFNGPLSAKNYQIDGGLFIATRPESGLAVGYLAGQYSAPSAGNFGGVYVGQEAGRYANTGAGNTFVGSFSGTGTGLNSGAQNSFFGYSSGYKNSGSMNTLLGYNAAGSNVAGNSNTVAGAMAAYYNDGGSNNAIFGYGAGQGANGTSNYSDNAVFGFNAGAGLTTGGSNVLLGSGAGSSLNSGAENIIIGRNQQAPAPTTSQFLNIGGTLFGDLNNMNVAIGSSSYISAEAKLTVKGAFNTSSDVTGASVTVTNAQDSANIYGVRAVAYSAGNPGSIYGGYFEGAGTAGNYTYGLYAVGRDYGVYGATSGGSSAGVYGTGNYGVQGSGTAAGVSGSNSSVSGKALEAIQGSTGYALYASGGVNYLGGNTGIGNTPGNEVLRVQRVVPSGTAEPFVLAVGTGSVPNTLTVSTMGVVAIGPGGILRGANMWQKIRTYDLGSAASSFSIPTLKGDADKEYKLVIRMKSGTSATTLLLRFNADSGTTYTSHTFGANGAAMATPSYSGTANGITIASLGSTETGGFIEGTIYADSANQPRTYLGKMIAVTGQSNWQTGGSWSGTGEITSIDLACATGSCLGINTHIELWSFR